MTDLTLDARGDRAPAWFWGMAGFGVLWNLYGKIMPEDVSSGSAVTRRCQWQQSFGRDKSKLDVDRLEYAPRRR